MGYILNIYFDDVEVEKIELMVGQLCDAGADLIYVKETAANGSGEIGSTLPYVSFFGIGDKKMARVQIQIGWFADQAELLKILDTAMRISADIGCKIYDTQLMAYVSHNNVHNIVYLFSRKAEDFFRMIDDHVMKSATWVPVERMKPRICEINPNDPILYQKIEEMELSVRPLYCLRKANIDYVGELVQITDEELRAIPNMGRKAVNQVIETLREMELSLGMRIGRWVKEEVAKLVARINNPYN